MRSQRVTALLASGALLLGACAADPGPTSEEIALWETWSDATMAGVEGRDGVLGALGGAGHPELMDVGAGEGVSMSIPGEVAVTGLELHCTGTAEMTFAYAVTVAQGISATIDGSCDGEPTLVDLADTGVGAAQVAVDAAEADSRGAYVVVLLGW